MDMSNIRTQLTVSPDEHESIDDSKTPTIALFLGDCCGVRLVQRGENDKHVCFEILSEDDGHWFLKQSYSSSYWLPDLMEALKAAEEWMKANCEPDMYKHVGGPDVQYGYNVKEQNESKVTA